MNKPVNQSGAQPWFNGAVVYQIFPRSFQDSNGDGIGDLAGITSRLDYLNDGKGGGLGISAIWLSPFYPSPMVDTGYDVSDYCDVDTAYGTLEDFDRLLSEAHRRNVKIIIDFVPNHTSDQHAWFKESRSSRDNPKRDWYIWRDAKPDGSPPNNWLGVFGGSAWEWDEEMKQYYLHSFVAKQPDLNWENPAVREAMTGVMRFWLDRGVDGFRVDAFDYMGKEPSLPDDPVNPHHQLGDDPYLALIHTYSRDGGNLQSYIEEMADTVDAYPDRLMVLETWTFERDKPPYYWQFYQSLPHDFVLPIVMELMFTPWSAASYREFVDTFQAGLRDFDYPLYVLGSHDRPRVATTIGPAAARTAAMFLLTMPGVTFLYNGEELGMENVSVPPELSQDPRGKISEEENRDPFRTPIHWSAGPNAGFSEANPWLPVGDFEVINAEAEAEDPGSMLNLHKKLIRLRQETPALRHGSYEPGPEIDPNVMTYSRSDGKEKYLIVLNFGDREVALPEMEGELVLSADLSRENVEDLILKPNEGLILRQK